jgi:hypothetical protein
MHVNASFPLQVGRKVNCCSYYFVEIYFVLFFPRFIKGFQLFNATNVLSSPHDCKLRLYFYFFVVPVCACETELPLSSLCHVAASEEGNVSYRHLFSLRPVPQDWLLRLLDSSSRSISFCSHRFPSSASSIVILLPVPFQDFSMMKPLSLIWENCAKLS